MFSGQMCHRSLSKLLLRVCFGQFFHYLSVLKILMWLYMYTATAYFFSIFSSVFLMFLHCICLELVKPATYIAFQPPLLSAITLLLTLCCQRKHCVISAIFRVTGKTKLALSRFQQRAKSDVSLALWNNYVDPKPRLQGNVLKQVREYRQIAINVSFNIRQVAQQTVQENVNISQLYKNLYSVQPVLMMQNLSVPHA